MIFLFNLGDVQVPAVDFQTCIRLVPVIIHGFAYAGKQMNIYHMEKSRQTLAPICTEQVCSHEDIPILGCPRKLVKG